MIRKHFKGYNFVCIPETGVTFRWGDSIAEDPYMAPWPELADISISNYCTNGCEYCYRASNEEGIFMTVADYKFILDQLTSKEYGSIFQVALGGGEPLLHPDFNEILHVTREEYGIIPNYTTCGKYFNRKNMEASKKYCGAVAVSWDPYRDNLSLEELRELGLQLKEEKIRTNIHYVISERTLIEAIKLLKGNYDEYLKDFNSVIFLTYKAAGRADKSDVIKSQKNLREFLDMVDAPLTELKLGFDACFVPVLMKATGVDTDLVDSCECGFFSVYVSESMEVMPCSFCNNSNFTYNLKDFCFKDIWQKHFSAYRSYVNDNCKTGCAECDKGSGCRGKCPFYNDIYLCNLV